REDLAARSRALGAQPRFFGRLPGVARARRRVGHFYTEAEERKGQVDIRQDNREAGDAAEHTGEDHFAEEQQAGAYGSCAQAGGRETGREAYARSGARQARLNSGDEGAAARGSYAQ